MAVFPFGQYRKAQWSSCADLLDCPVASSTPLLLVHQEMCTHGDDPRKEGWVMEI